MLERKRYLVPPKLQTRLLLGGMTVGEWLFFLGCLLLAIFLHIFFLFVAAGVEAILCWRLDKERNALWYLVLVAQYYSGVQSYSGRV